MHLRNNFAGAALAAVLVLAPGFARAQTGGAYDLRWHALGGGGIVGSSGGAYRLSELSGALAGPMDGNGYQLNAGPVRHDRHCALRHRRHRPTAGRDPSDFGGPVAVLVGPGAVSSGDQVANLLKFRANTRFFWKNTAAAFNAPAVVDLGQPGWYSRLAEDDAFNVGQSANFLTHDEFTVDEPVWLATGDVARHVDTVAFAALLWLGVPGDDRRGSRCTT